MRQLPLVTTSFMKTMTQQTNLQALCAEQLPELRGMFERILCVARSSGGPTVGNIQLADRLIDAVVNWFENSLAQPETSSRLHYCSTHGQQPENAWGCPECVREMRQRLAQPEPEGVTEEAWQWYSYCPEDGIELHFNKESAQKAAQEIMGSYAKAAHSDGWHEDMGSVSWGMLLPVEQAQVVERTEAEPDSEFDEWIRYGLVPSHYASPAIEPVPVSERPWECEGWCDTEGRCWLHRPAEIPCRLANGTLYRWVLDTPCWDEEGPLHDTHSLPHHALPVPTSNGAKPEPMRQHS